MKYKIEISDNRDELVTRENLKNENHFLKIIVNQINNDIYFNFSTKLALYDFARSLLYESLHGDSGQLEFYNLSQNDKNYLVNGLRLMNCENRLFINYPSDPIDEKLVKDE